MLRRNGNGRFRLITFDDRSQEIVVFVLCIQYHSFYDRYSAICSQSLKTNCIGPIQIQLCRSVVSEPKAVVFGEKSNEYSPHSLADS